MTTHRASVTPAKAGVQTYAWIPAFAGMTISCALALSAPPAAAAAQAQPFHLEGLRTEYHVDPIGIDVRAPRLSWKLHAERRGTTQSAYEIRVAADSASLVTGRAPLVQRDPCRLSSADPLQLDGWPGDH